MHAYDGAGVKRLRFVFDDAVLSLGLAADATFADVAQALGGLSRSTGRGLIAIDVTVAQRGLGNPLISLRARRRAPASA